MQEAACIPTRAAVTIQGDAHEELMCSCLHVMSCHGTADSSKAAAAKKSVDNKHCRNSKLEVMRPLFVWSSMHCQRHRDTVSDGK